MGYTEPKCNIEHTNAYHSIPSRALAYHVNITIYSYYNNADTPVSLYAPLHPTHISGAPARCGANGLLPLYIYHIS